jgi:hypothetical protein
MRIKVVRPEMVLETGDVSSKQALKRTSALRVVDGWAEPETSDVSTNL